jgi:hypothetical protein
MADLHEITLGDGTTLKTALPPSRLAELGLPARPVGTSIFDSGATAFQVQPTDGGISQIPGLGQALGTGMAPKRSDVPTLNLGAQPALPVESAESVAESDKAAARAIDRSREGRERTPGGGVSRFGAETKNIEPSTDAGPQGYAPPAPRIIKIKGGDVRTGYTVAKTGATDAIPEYEEQAADARINQKLAAQAQGDVTKDRLELERGAAAEEEIRRQEAIANAQAKQAEMQRRVAEAEQQQAELDAEHKAIQEAKVNPNEYWDNLGTGGKVLAAIGMIASGINAGMRGGPNQTAEFIYRAIRDNVADQRAKLEARRQGLNIRQTMLEKKAARYGGNLELASQELEANQLALAAATARKHAADSGIASVDPGLMALAAQLDAEAADKRLDNLAKNGARVQESFQNIPDRVVQVGGAPVKPEVRERKVELGDGRFGYARSATQAKEAQDKLTPGSDIIAGLNELRELRRQSSEVDVTPTQMSAIKQRMRAIALGLAPRMNVQVGQGAMSEDEVKQNMQKMGDPEAVVKGAADAAIEETIRIQERANRSIARDYLYADPDATTPLIRGQAQGGLRREQ